MFKFHLNAITNREGSKHIVVEFRFCGQNHLNTNPSCVILGITDNLFKPQFPLL